MRYAILGDIHSNLEAFQAVLEDIKQKGGVDGFWCVGDIVGYGPDPRACLELVKEHQFTAVAGNHDWAVAAKVDISDFNGDAAEAATWTAGLLSAVEKDYLSRLPLRLVAGDFTLVHGSPRQPIWEYLLSAGVARENMELFETPYCLIGHSHIPLYFELVDGEKCYLKEFPAGTPLKLGENPLIINPGAVGQPRDGDTRASYLIYDQEKAEVSHNRAAYDFTVTQGKMGECGLPEHLAARLGYGM